MTTHAIPDDPDNYWARLNYGVVGVRTKTVCVVEGYLTHTFHIPLPPLSTPKIPPEVANSACNKECMNLRTVSNTTRGLLAAMQASITNMIRRVHDLVPNIVSAQQNRRRSSRGVFDFVGSASSWAFGTATMTDINELKKHIEDVKLLADTAAADSAHVKSSMIAFTQLSNERFDKLHQVVNEQQRAFSAIASEIQSIADSSKLELNAIVTISSELARYVEIHDTIQELELGVEDLINGQITPKLIDTNDINRALQNATITLGKQSMTLCVTTAKDVYGSQSFDFARYMNDLFIRIRLPYTRHAPMAVYKTFVLPIPIPGSQGLVTILKDFPRWLVRSDNIIGELTEAPASPVIESYHIMFHNRHQFSCLFAIVSDDPEAVLANCDFTTRRAFIEPVYIRLNATTYVISNLTKPRTLCKFNRRRPLSIEPCSPCLISLPCGCYVSSSEFRLAGPIDCSDALSSASVLHGVNLIILQNFYDLANVTLTGNTLFSPNRTYTPAPLRLPIFGENTSRLLASDESIGYSLRKLVSSLANESIVLHSPSEAILYDYINRMAQIQNKFPNFHEPATWFIITPFPCVIILAILYVALRRRLYSLQVLAGIQPLLPKASAFVLRTTVTTPPIPTAPSFLDQWIVDIRNHDVTVIVFLTLAFVWLLCLTYGVYRSLSRNTCLYLDFSSEHCLLQLRYFTLPNASRCYEVKMSRGPTSLAFRSYFFFGVLSFKTRPWCLYNTVNDRKSPLPAIILVAPWHIRKLKLIMKASTYNVYPLIVHSHEYNYYQPPSQSPLHSLTDVNKEPDTTDDII